MAAEASGGPLSPIGRLAYLVQSLAAVGIGWGATAQAMTGEGEDFRALPLLILLASLLWLLFATARRLVDVEMHPGWALLQLVPLVGGVQWLYLVLVRGKLGYARLRRLRGQ